MSILVIMQGASGSGKTHLANLLATSIPDAKVVSTDNFWARHCIPFSPARLQDAHDWNQGEANHWLSQGFSVIVDNTNIRAWEAKPYVLLGLKHKVANIYFVRATGCFPNVHGVPEEVVVKMRSNLEPLTVEGCLAAERLVFVPKEPTP